MKKVAETANLMEYKEIQKLCHSGACDNTTWHGTLSGNILMANELIFIVEALLVDQNSPHSSGAVEAFNGDPPFWTIHHTKSTDKLKALEPLWQR